MITKKLVSIITPCFNGEAFIHRLLDSVLSQDYKYIEHIIIDDGSTDDTAQIIKKYVLKYKEVGKTLIYKFQTNGKAGAALNAGLKLFTGEYLTWPDSDDFYSQKNSISKMVDAINNSEFGIVRCDANLVDENTLIVKSKFSDVKINPEKQKLFKDCILENNFWYTPGCYLTKSKVIDEVIEGRDIFTNNDVQNWQMLLPIFFSYKCYYINEPLHNYLVRSTSYCHQPIDYNKAIDRTYIHEEIIVETLKRIKKSTLIDNKYFSMVDEKYLKKRLDISFEYNQSKDFYNFFNMLKSSYPINITYKVKLKKILVNYPLLIKFIRKVQVYVFKT
jgi:glycosyltransferase involved in cell wall biosynthesis